MKEIHISDPAKLIRFFRCQGNQNNTIIEDSSKKDMMALNKLNRHYVIPIEKSVIKETTSKPNINVIDPNTAAVNQAKQELKNDVTISNTPQIRSTVNCIKSTKKRKSTSCCANSVKTTSKPRCKRKKTAIKDDIFSD